MLSRTKQLYLVTPAVYAAVIMGGGYGALSIGLILVYVVPVTLWVIKATFFKAGSKP